MERKKLTKQEKQKNENTFAKPFFLLFTLN